MADAVDMTLPRQQALTGGALLSKLVTGEFEKRIGAPERKVRQLESQK